jgi:hypothetical protein
MSGSWPVTDPNAEAGAGWSAAATRAERSAATGLDGTGGAGPTASDEGASGLNFLRLPRSIGVTFE